jgi:hypothetical protein
MEHQKATVFSTARRIVLKVQDLEHTLVRNFSVDPDALVRSMSLFQSWLNQ